MTTGSSGRLKRPDEAFGGGCSADTGERGRQRPAPSPLSTHATLGGPPPRRPDRPGAVPPRVVPHRPSRARGSVGPVRSPRQPMARPVRPRSRRSTSSSTRPTACSTSPVQAIRSDDFRSGDAIVADTNPAMVGITGRSVPIRRSCPHRRVRVRHVASPRARTKWTASVLHRASRTCESSGSSASSKCVPQVVLAIASTPSTQSSSATAPIRR